MLALALRRSAVVVTLLCSLAAGLLAAACAPSSSAAVADGGSDATSEPPVFGPPLTPPDGGAPAAPSGSAPRRWPAPAEPAVTHDVGEDLVAVLESERTSGACERYRAGETDRETELLCGKHMFFEETFGTVGIPAPLLHFLMRHYEDFYGTGFSNLGLVARPNDDEKMPVGLAPTTGTLGTVETRAFTCASCHFGQLPDGRYAVGYGNMDFDYGLLIASLGAPLMLSMDAEDPEVHPDLRALLAEPVAAAKEKTGYMIDLAITGFSLSQTGSDGTGLDVEGQGRFLALEPGTMDFLTEPLVDDGVWTVSRLLSLWNLPDEEQRAAAGMPHELLSWTAGVKRLEVFLQGFVAVGDAEDAAWTEEDMKPLASYLRTLRTPPALSPPPVDLVEEGALLFVAHDCLSCHVGPSGEGARAFSFEEIGTDDAMAQVFNPVGDDMCCGFEQDPDGYELTRGVKAPRMTGLEWQRGFLHTGSVHTLEQLFCLQPRPESTAEAQGSGGHEDLCDDLGDDEKQALIAYLKSL